MRKSLALILIFGACFSSCKKKQEDILAGIKKNTEQINNNLNKLTKRQVDDLTSVVGGTITGYFRDDEIRKIYTEHFGEKSRVFAEYYFDEGMLIFVLKQEYVYNKPQSYTEELARANNDSVWYDDKLTKLQVSKYYFDKNKLIKWIDGSDNNTDVPVNKPEFTNKQSSLWAETVILIKQLKED